jgi:uncharacterized protein YaiE (UPF0345 family)
MSEFKNVSVVKAANVYFDGKVTSRTVVFADGSKKSLGFMLPGEYTFNTGVPEVMEVLGGSMDYKLAPEDEWTSVGAGESFDVPGEASFSVRVGVFADYCCSYTE